MSQRILILAIFLCISYFLGGWGAVKYGLLSKELYFGVAGIVGGLASVTGLFSFFKTPLTKKDLVETEFEQLKILVKNWESLEKLRTSQDDTKAELDALIQKKNEIKSFVENVDKDKQLNKIANELSYTDIADEKKNRELMEDRVHQLLFVSHLSVNYHSHAEIFYTSIIKITEYLAIIFSTAFILGTLEILSLSLSIKIFGVALSILLFSFSAIMIFMEVPSKTSIHSRFISEWTNIVNKIQSLKSDGLEDSTLRILESDAKKLHAQEPRVIYHRWQISAYDKTCKSMGLQPQNT